MSIQPQDIGSSAGSEGFMGSYVVPEDPAIVLGTMNALPVVRYVVGAGPVVKDHVPSILFKSRLHVVVTYDELRMRPYLGRVQAPGITAQTKRCVLNRLRVNVIYQFRNTRKTGTAKNLGVLQIVYPNRLETATMLVYALQGSRFSRAKP